MDHQTAINVERVFRRIADSCQCDGGNCERGDFGIDADAFEASVRDSVVDICTQMPILQEHEVIGGWYQTCRGLKECGDDLGPTQAESFLEDILSL